VSSIGWLSSRTAMAPSGSSALVRTRMVVPPKVSSSATARTIRSAAFRHCDEALEAAGLQE
jgi:hypothetical protein